MRVQSAMVFVDWDSARRFGRRVRVSHDPVAETEAVIELLQDQIASYIGKPDSTIRVGWRIYHGWHEGEQETQDKRIFDKFILSYRTRSIGRISFGNEFRYGDDLICESMRSPLRYTLRKRQKDGVFEFYQKMVDSSLTVDLLHVARSRTHDYVFIIGDDDDLLPGIFTAEKWGARVAFFRITNISSLPVLKGKEKGFPLIQM